MCVVRDVSLAVDVTGTASGCVCCCLPQLYDLMTMGFKHQILGCTCPTQLLQVTLNHMETVRSLVEGNPVVELIEEAIAVVTSVRWELWSRS